MLQGIRNPALLCEVAYSCCSERMVVHCEWDDIILIAPIIRTWMVGGTVDTIILFQGTYNILEGIKAA